MSNTEPEYLDGFEIIDAAKYGTKLENLSRAETRNLINKSHISVDTPFISDNFAAFMSTVPTKSIRQSETPETQSYKNFITNSTRKLRLKMAYINCDEVAAGNTKYCYNCRNCNSAKNKFCINCGSFLPPNSILKNSTCVSCSKHNEYNEPYCTECGEKLYLAQIMDEINSELDKSLRIWWEETLPKYPFWDSAKFIDDIKRYDAENGGLYYELSFRDDDSDYAEPMPYRDLLVQYGFVQYDENPTRVFLCLNSDSENLYVNIGKQSMKMSYTLRAYFSTGSPIIRND